MTSARAALLAVLLLAPWAALAQRFQCPEQRLDPVLQIGLGEFGFDLAMNERHLIVGDPNSDVWCGGDPSCGKGAAYAYTYDDVRGEWAFLEFIFPNDIAVPRGGGFGPAVDLHGNRAIIGSYGAGDLGGAYVFEFEEGHWIQTAQLLPPPDPRRYPWGEHAAIWGDSAVFGNGGEAVMVFAFEAGMWTEVTMLVSPDSPAARSDFGDAMDINDQWLAIGAFGEKIFGPEHGAVYLYRLEGNGEPIYTQKLLPPRPTEGHRFGASVCIGGEWLVVGAPLSKRGTSTTSPEGAAFVYRLINGRWELVQELEAIEPRPGANFGSGVAVDEGVIAVGARRELTDSSRGSAQLFRLGASGRWLPAAHVAPSLPGVVPINIGESVALAHGRLVIGGSDSLYDGVDLGSAHAYDLACLLCPPDLDADGSLTVFDFLTFLNLFQDADPLADFDGDGELTIFDFLAFQTAFDAGCV